MLQLSLNFKNRINDRAMIKNYYDYKLFQHHCSNTTRSVFFVERVWNSLPFDLVDFFNLKSFTRSIKTIDISGYCIGST